MTSLRKARRSWQPRAACARCIRTPISLPSHLSAQWVSWMTSIGSSNQLWGRSRFAAMKRCVIRSRAGPDHRLPEFGNAEEVVVGLLGRCVAGLHLGSQSGDGDAVGAVAGPAGVVGE